MTASDAIALLSPEVVRRELCIRSFADFMRFAWPHFEPTRALLPSIAIDALCAALQAVGERRIRRLAIACPPGVSKSLVTAVAFPAWLLLRTDGAARIMSGSYAYDLAKRDSRRCRDLVASAWYRALAGGRWAVRDDADQAGDWWSSTGGRRLCTSTGSKALGERATIQLLDDVLSGADVHSAAKRLEARRWLSEVLPSRLEDPENDSRVIVGQRLHVEDPVSLAIEQGWSVLSLPAVLAENDTPCVLLDDAGELVWRDPRKPGEPLVSLLSTEALDRLRLELGSAAYSAQYLQKPHDDTNAMFPRKAFERRWTELPDKPQRTVIALDASFKESASSDWAVLQCWQSKGSDRVLVEQWRKQAGFVDTLNALRAMQKRYPFAKVLIEAGANGHAVFDQFKREVPGVFEVKPEGGKTARAASVQAIVESGAVVLPANAPWVDDWIDEVSAFPAVKHDDQADAMVYALRELQGGTDAKARYAALSRVPMFVEDSAWTAPSRAAAAPPAVESAGEQPEPIERTPEQQAKHDRIQKRLYFRLIRGEQNVVDPHNVPQLRAWAADAKRRGVLR